MSRSKRFFFLILLVLIAAPVSAGEDLFETGVKALKGKDYHFAVACMNEVIQKDSKNVKAYNFRALAYLGRAKWAEAIKDFSEVIRLDPKFPDVYMNRGHAYFEKKDYEKAIADLTTAIQLSFCVVDEQHTRGEQSGRSVAVRRFLTGLITGSRIANERPHVG